MSTFVLLFLVSLQLLGLQAKEMAPDCGAALDTGHCWASFTMYHYDKNTGNCNKFIFGGCGGNSNSFGTKDECLAKCGKERRAIGPRDCISPPETGNCKGAFPRYYFDVLDHQCKSFTWGGCHVNGNNYRSKGECEMLCLPQD